MVAPARSPIGGGSGELVSTRVLFLDDSGKPDMNHPSSGLVIGGVAIPSSRVPTLSRRLAGAKAKFYPKRGDPALWELKSSYLIKPNPWKRRTNRDFVDETLRIVAQTGCTIYTVSIDKSRMHHPMTLKTTMPLQLQALVEHFAVECDQHRETGMIVSDWSSRHLDAHASKCVGSFITTRRFPLHPSVYYGNSLTTQAIQIADLIAGVRRRVVEWDRRLAGLNRRMAATRTLSSDQWKRTVRGRTYTNQIVLI